MSQAATSSDSSQDSDSLLAHQFIRRFGRRPSSADLERYRLSRQGVGLRVPARLRRQAAMLITRL